MSSPKQMHRYEQTEGGPVASGFAAQYRQMLDSQLPQLAQESEQLIPEAADALNAELALRKISAEQLTDSDVDPLASDTERKCPICGFNYNVKWQGKTLYGHYVCASCSHSLWTRRALAHCIDDFVITIVVPTLGFIALTLARAGAEWFAVPLGIVPVLWLLKDGRGLSIGKLIAGIELIDVRTARPASCLASLKRNLPLFIPFVPIIIAFQMHAGPRLGDEWAHTRVVLRKHRDKSPFTVLISPSGARR